MLTTNYLQFMTKYLIIVVFLFGCNKAQRQLEKTQEYLFKHPEFSAGYCAEQFPEKTDSLIVKTDTVIEILFMDSLVFNTDTLYRDSLGFKYRTIVKTVTKTIHKDSIIYRENTAALKSCQIDNSNITALLVKKTDESDRYKGQAKKRGIIMWALIFLIIGAIGMRLYLKSKSIIK